MVNAPTNGRSLRISVFGLGYVGCVSAACLARDGHTVIGVDVNAAKAEMMSRGESPIVEPGLEDILAAGVSSGRLRATTDVAAAVAETDVGLVCVGTPSLANGGMNLQFVERVATSIGTELRGRDRPFTLLLRSTVLPTTTEALFKPLVNAASGSSGAVRFGFHPEFLREATAIADYDEPSRVVVGCTDAEVVDVVRALYPRCSVPVVQLDFALAELVKYADNSFHALKVVFANELGAICRAAGVDGRALMETFVQDKKLNLSPVYLKPGAPFGGSCLPKDLRALIKFATDHSVTVPTLRSVLPSNDAHKKRVLDAVRENGDRNVAVLGLSFKSATDDLRESPAVDLVETLIGKGHVVKVFDPTVRASALIGSNLSYVQRELPHLERVLVDTLEGALADAGVVVVTTNHPAFQAAPPLLQPSQLLIDLVGLVRSSADLKCRYASVCW
jgi:GDP-mannose 6-dehydrogenase